MNSALKTKEIWASCLKNKSFDEMIKCYAENFIFRGTFNKKPTSSKQDLSKYFKNLLKNVESVTFYKNHTYMTHNKIFFDMGRYNFKTTKGIIQAQYLMAFDEKGKIIIHHSTFYE